MEFASVPALLEIKSTSWPMHHTLPTSSPEVAEGHSNVYGKVDTAVSASKS